MPRIEESITIAAATADTFRFCHDIARRPEWDERVMSVKLLSPEPVRRGTLLRIDAAHAGKFSFTWDAEYTDFQFPHSSKLWVIDAAPSSPFDAGSESWQFHSTSGGARFTLVWDYRLRGILARVADALGRRRSTRRAIQRSLTNLKAKIESGRVAGA